MSRNAGENGREPVGECRDAIGDEPMTDKVITIGHVINVTGMLEVFSGLVLFAFAMVLLLFRRGLGFDIASAFHRFW